jgi:hypothetical protein
MPPTFALELLQRSLLVIDKEYIEAHPSSNNLQIRMKMGRIDKERASWSS